MSLDDASRDQIFEAAMLYHEQGFAVLPVTKDKTPTVKWKEEFQARWLRDGQSAQDIRSLFAVPPHGVALLTHPFSPIVVVDFDGPHAEAAWEATGITLPETSTNYSQSGFPHRYFSPPDNVNGLKRKIRLAQEVHPCGWKKGKTCGVDVLVNGLVVVPPTPGYREDPDHPFGVFAPLPDAVVELIHQQERQRGEASTHAATDTIIGGGQRNNTLTSLAGSMRRRGMTADEIFAGLTAVNTQRCRPLLAEREVREIAESVARYEPSGTGGAEPEHLTDLGNARRLVALHGRDLRYCFAWRAWVTWDGRRWQRDDTGEPFRRAKDTIRSVYREASGCEDERQRKALAQHAARCEADSKLRALLSVAQSEPELIVRPEEFDLDPMLLTVANGTLDLRTGSLLPHRRKDLITKLAPVAYDPHAKAPTWERFLRRILNDCVELIAFLQRAIGYTLTGRTAMQVWFLLHGIGANGKSTLLRTLTDLLGEYALWTPVQTLLSKRGEHIENDLARLHNARMVAAVEAEGGRRLAEALVKQLTGGDAVTARFLYGEYFSFLPAFKLWFATNHKPQIRGSDLATWRRIRLVPFDVTIPEAEQDRELPEKLRAEFPGILVWAVRGCLAWQRDGLGVPDSVRHATAEYREAMDLIGAFLSERCTLDPGASVGATDLYRAYCAWCEQGKEHPESQQRFGEALSERGYRVERHRVTNRKIRVGLRLLSEHPEHPRTTFRGSF